VNIRFGLIKTTLIDYPGHVAAGLFTHGCNLRCPYCHNPELVCPENPVPGHFLSAGEVLAFLETRSNVLDGVCISGGEPLLQPELPEMAGRIRDLGLKIKIDTNGLLPEKLSSCSPDYAAMDIKTAPSKYSRVGFRKPVRHLLEETVNRILSMGIPHQFRTTLVPGIVTMEDAEEIAELIPPGALYIINRFRSDVTLDPSFSAVLPFSEAETAELRDFFLQKGVNCRLGSKK
jgi:pyruvate formate lyase activating enzyme